MKKTELSENPKAIDIILASDEALNDANRIQRTRSELQDLLKRKETEISKEIRDEILEVCGGSKSNITVSTSIFLKKAIVCVGNWKYNVEYRDGDLIIITNNEKKSDVKLSEMNEVFSIISKVIINEGLK